MSKTLPFWSKSHFNEDVSERPQLIYFVHIDQARLWMLVITRKHVLFMRYNASNGVEFEISLESADALDVHDYPPTASYCKRSTDLFLGYPWRLFGSSAISRRMESKCTEDIFPLLIDNYSMSTKWIALKLGPLCGAWWCLPALQTWSDSEDLDVFFRKFV